MPLMLALLGGVCATLFGVVFGLPSLRIKGCTWRWPRWPRSSSPTGCSCASSGSPGQRLGLGRGLNLSVLGIRWIEPGQYLFCLAVLALLALAAKNLVRGAIGREWMAIRDMDVAAAVIGIRPMYAKLTAFAVSSFIVGVAGALWASSTWARGSRRPSRSTSRSSCCS
jgi:branched-chain amino acid transport system permease protein